MQLQLLKVETRVAKSPEFAPPVDKIKCNFDEKKYLLWDITCLAA